MFKLLNPHTCFRSKKEEITRGAIQGSTLLTFFPLPPFSSICWTYKLFAHLVQFIQILKFHPDFGHVLGNIWELVFRNLPWPWENYVRFFFGIFKKYRIDISAIVGTNSREINEVFNKSAKYVEKNGRNCTVWHLQYCAVRKPSIYPVVQYVNIPAH